MQRRFFLFGTVALATSPAFADNPLNAVASAYEAATGGHIGIYAKNLTSGASLAWRAQDRFVMCSSFKASLVALVLSRVDRGDDRLDVLLHYSAADIKNWYAPVARANLPLGAMTLRAMCEASIEQSDNTCATILLNRVGGPQAVTNFWRSIGDNVSRLDDPEPILNRTPLGGVRDTTTPLAMATTFQHLALGNTLSKESRALFVLWLKGNETGLHRLRAGFPDTWSVGDKTGNNGKDASGDVVVAWSPDKHPIVLAAYTRGGNPTESQFAETFKAIGQVVSTTLA